MKIADNAQLYVGLEKGIYEKEGLHIELRELQSGSRILEALASKSGEGVDIGFSSLVSILLARARGLSIVTFAGGPLEEAGRPTHGLLVSRSSSVTNPKDLAGKRIAVNALKNVEHLMLTRYLRQVKVDPSSVTVVEIGFSQMPPVLKAGQIDAACAIEPYLTAALKEGAGRLLAHHYGTVSERIAVSTYISTEDKVASRREAFRKFISATQLATEYISAHPDETLQIVLKYTKLDAAIAGRAAVPPFQQKHSIADLEFWVNMMQQEQYLTRGLDIKALLPEF